MGKKLDPKTPTLLDRPDALMTPTVVEGPLGRAPAPSPEPAQVPRAPVLPSPSPSIATPTLPDVRPPQPGVPTMSMMEGAQPLPPPPTAPMPAVSAPVVMVSMKDATDKQVRVTAPVAVQLRSIADAHGRRYATPPGGMGFFAPPRELAASAAPVRSSRATIAWTATAILLAAAIAAAVVYFAR